MNSTAYTSPNSYLAASAGPPQFFAQVFHPDVRVRLKVAEATTLPTSILAVLAIDKSFEVRMLVSENPLTPLAMLEHLAADEHPDVRYAMAENANMPSHILERLVDDENPYVSARASKTLMRLGHTISVELLSCA